MIQQVPGPVIIGIFLRNFRLDAPLAARTKSEYKKEKRYISFQDLDYFPKIKKIRAKECPYFDYYLGGLLPVSPPGPSIGVSILGVTVVQSCFTGVSEFEGDTKPINRKKINWNMIQKF